MLVAEEGTRLSISNIEFATLSWSSTAVTEWSRYCCNLNM